MDTIGFYVFMTECEDQKTDPKLDQEMDHKLDHNFDQELALILKK
jgi:hypothetical protein